MAPHISMLLLLFLGSASSNFSSAFSETSRKELRNKKEDDETVIYLSHSTQSERANPSHVVQISWQPRVFVYKSLVSEQECNHLLSLANKTSEDINFLEGRDSALTLKWELPFDTSDAVVLRIEEKISAWTFLPKGNSRPMQILHYGQERTDQKYNYYGITSALKGDQPLMASVILFLSNVTRGGEILFPDSEPKNTRLESKGLPYSARDSSLLRPIKGNAILFFHVHPNASPDKGSSHERHPVVEGDMWCATKNFYLRPVRGQAVQLESDECTDEDSNCPQWAANGECQRNPVFMVGSPDYYGTCRKSCTVC